MDHPGRFSISAETAVPLAAEIRRRAAFSVVPLPFKPHRLDGLTDRLILSHYENNYGGALRRLNSITEQLESLDFSKAPVNIVNGLKREQLIALNSTLLHELYFASLGGEGKPTAPMAEALSSDFGSVDRWHEEFVAKVGPPRPLVQPSSAICRPSAWKR